MWNFPSQCVQSSPRLRYIYAFVRSLRDRRIVVYLKCSQDEYLYDEVEKVKPSMNLVLSLLSGLGTERKEGEEKNKRKGGEKVSFVASWYSFSLPSSLLPRSHLDNTRLIRIPSQSNERDLGTHSIS